MNVFIVSLFSYIGLFFVLPHELWLVVKGLISSFFPFRGRAYSYESLVCSQQIFSVKPALKDVWAFNVSLLAVRSPLFVTPPLGTLLSLSDLTSQIVCSSTFIGMRLPTAFGVSTSFLMESGLPQSPHQL